MEYRSLEYISWHAYEPEDLYEGSEVEPMIKVNRYKSQDTKLKRVVKTVLLNLSFVALVR